MNSNFAIISISTINTFGSPFITDFVARTLLHGQIIRFSFCNELLLLCVIGRSENLGGGKCSASVRFWALSTVTFQKADQVAVLTVVLLFIMGFRKL